MIKKIFSKRDLKLPIIGSLIAAASLLSTTVSATAEVDINQLRQQSKIMFGTLSETMPGSENDTPAMVELGKTLFMDKRLSVNDSQSCNSCHQVGNYNGSGVDNEATSLGALPGTKGDRNSPTVWNSGFQIAQFWDGRAENLKAQAKGPILNPVEMGMPSEGAVETKISKIDKYQVSFKQAFGHDNAISYNNIAHAIAAFERTLITNDRFDTFMKGDDHALTKKELKGLQTFINTGCSACHNGKTLGGNMYQKMGLVNEYPHQEDLGRYKVTGSENDKMVFKVPMLRDVSRSAPYFHDGSVETIEQAIYDMAWHQLGQKLNKQQVSDIAAFLNALEHQAN
ncbi:cytochrome-c peroxidase [Microbulbifer sp. A4B17]|uniref:cytochrome-c peroxidase n=1 Tax=Microbulbifer sp. A4B17 TaxID=359370 RepID=UPI000D52DE67|nr:cytochrome c peroxidase [Microbulbifer sp. A4B17]AWF80260.1 cytochrome-c peroxidase [Microbulbifer sp. A4B17]